MIENLQVICLKIANAIKNDPVLSHVYEIEANGMSKMDMYVVNK